MEFWGLEVKPGTAVKCVPADDYIIHLSQAALGESKKPSDNATMYVKVDNQKLAIGTLSADKYPQIQFDLVFEKEVELSHTSKTSSVFFSGYKVHQPVDGDEMDLDSEEDEDEEEEEMHNLMIKENGKAQGKEVQKGGKAGAAASKANVVAGVRKNNDDSNEDETDDSDEDEDLSPDEEGDEGSSDEDDSSEEDEESDEDDAEETPKPEAGKKRVAENALKTPASDKKAKVATPSGQKTGGKKNTHVATPHPAKQASETSAKNDKKSPKSGGSVSCNSCSKTFNSEMALQAHAKAKKH